MNRSFVLGSWIACSATLACATLPEMPAPDVEEPAWVFEQDTPEKAFRDLVDADHWRKRNAARDRLIEFGDEAFDLVLEGSEHKDIEVRATCFEILRDRYSKAPETIAALLRGLRDENRTYVAYPAAFHFGEYELEEGREALLQILSEDETDERTRFAAAKSLGELGAVEVTVLLWTGLGSDDGYTRYLSNLGMKGLTGKDLTSFEYESPWEGAFVSGPAVATTQGQPIRKAENRVSRWTAIVEFTRWLEANQPELFAELETKLW